MSVKHIFASYMYTGRHIYSIISSIAFGDGDIGDDVIRDFPRILANLSGRDR